MLFKTLFSCFCCFFTVHWAARALFKIRIDAVLELLVFDKSDFFNSFCQEVLEYSH
eukprot:c12965_g1_i1 orf=1-165(-)